MADFFRQVAISSQALYNSFLKRSRIQLHLIIDQVVSSLSFTYVIKFLIKIILSNLTFTTPWTMLYTALFPYFLC